MIKYIIAFFITVGVIALIVANPILLLFIGIFLAGYYAYKKQPNLFSAGEENGGSETEEELETTQEIYKKQIDKEMKKDFEKDPEWIAKRDTLRRAIEKNQRQEDANMEKEMEECS